MTSVAPTIDEMLNEVDYSLNPSYVPSDFALEFVNFIKLVNGEDGEENKSPVMHYKMLDTVASGAAKIANMCHRGSAKTTLLNEYMVLYIAVYKELPGLSNIELAMYVSDSMENGVKNFRKNVEYRWQNSEFLQHYVPKTKFTDNRLEFTNIDGKVFIVKCYGASTGVRGVKERGTRPVLALLDDLVGDKDAKSPTITASIEDTVYRAVNYALHPESSLIIWSGTPFNSNDPLYKAVNSGAWATNVYPVCEKFPCSREEFRGSWPSRFGYDYVLAQYQSAVKQGIVGSFNQELLLRIISDEERVILDSDIKWYSLTSLLKNRANFNFYVTTDFATSVKSSSDLSIIAVWGYNNNGDWFLVDGIARQQLMDANINDLFRLVQKWSPQSVGIEVSGQQGGFIPWLQNEMINRNVWFNLASENNKSAPGIRPLTDKRARFNVIVPTFKLGKMYFPTEEKDSIFVSEAINELSLVTQDKFKSKHDDFIDVISMLSVMNPWKPSEISKTQQNINSDIWEIPTEEDDDQMSSYIV